jgi:NADH:ubiquinone oxidoreductase subunit F (NADH-binding)
MYLVSLFRSSLPLCFLLMILLVSYSSFADNTVTLRPGDTIFVPMAVDEIKSGLTVVYIMGELFKPGAYESSSGVSFLDILANAGGPTRFAETRQIRIIRQDGSVSPFDLQQFTEGRK